MNILITGITGFVGSHLAEYYLKNLPKVKIYGTIFSHHLGDELHRIKHIKNKIELLECDLNNRVAVYRVIKKSTPSKIYHLAAQSFVPVSWHSPEDTLINNIISELNIFETVRDLKINPKILIACSSEEYGLVLEDELPINEKSLLRPLSPYAVSKITQDMLAYQYSQSYGLKTIITRAFNHTGPRRGEQFVCSNFAKQIAEIEKGKKKPIIHVGNLNAKRDFTDVRDIVRAYHLATEKCKTGEQYVICSGKTITIKLVLNLLIKLSTIKDIKITEDPERMRPSDVPILLGDYSKFNKQTNWNPEIPFEKTLEDLLNYWRKEI